MEDKKCQCCGRDAGNGKAYLEPSGEYTYYCTLRCLQIHRLGGTVNK